MTGQSNPITGKGFLNVAVAGINNAAASLDMLVPGRLSMDVLWAGSVPTPNLAEISGNPEDIVVGAYVGVTGEAPGHALLIFPRPSAMQLSDLILDREPGETTEIGEYEESLIQEIANILTSSYLTAIADHYGVTLLPTPPATATDMAAALIDTVLSNSGQFEPETLSIVTRFRCSDRALDGYFLYIPEVICTDQMEAA
jgi:chemotaxis protein CheC